MQVIYTCVNTYTYIYMLIYVYKCVSVTCMHVHTRFVLVEIRGQLLGVLSLLPPYFRVGSPVCTGVHTGSQVSSSSPGPTCYVTTGVLGLQTRATAASFSHGLWGRNEGHKACDKSFYLMSHLPACPEELYEENSLGG